MIVPLAWMLSALGGPVEVRWDAPHAGCPTAEQARERIEQRVGDRPPEAMVVEGVVERDEDSFVLRLTITDRGEVVTRSLPAPSCDELLDAAVFLTALVVDGEEDPFADVPIERPQSVVPPAAPVLPVAPSPTAEPEPTTAPEPVPAPQVTVEPEPRARTGIGGLATAGVGVVGGSIPGAGVEVRAGAAAVGRRWMAGAQVAYAPPRTVTLAEFDDRGARAQAWHVALEGGLRWPLSRRVHLPALLGVELGAVHARGFGVQSTTSRAQPWVAGAGGLGLEVALGAGVGLWLRGRIAVPLARPAFRIDGRGTVFRSASAAGSGSVGISFRWG